MLLRGTGGRHRRRASGGSTPRRPRGPCWRRRHRARAPSPSRVPPPQPARLGRTRLRGGGIAPSQQFFSPNPELRAGRFCSAAPRPRRFYYSCDSALPFTTQVPSRALQPSGAASWEADGRLRQEASYLLRNCLCGILTIWKEYGNETFSEIELLS